MHPPVPLPTTFHHFPDLPVELRLKIWQAACTSRILPVTYSIDLDKFSCTTKPPHLLSVSHEARNETLRHYPLYFGTKTHPTARIYFNPNLDILYKPRHREMGYDEVMRDLRSFVHDPENTLDNIRYIALDYVTPDVKRPWEAYNKASFIRSFKALHEVYLLLESDEYTDMKPSGEVKLVEPTGSPERLMKLWYYFRQSFLFEEKILEDVCYQSGRNYERYFLPTLRIKEKVPVTRTEDEAVVRLTNLFRWSNL
jgi:hypothetical protein